MSDFSHLSEKKIKIDGRKYHLKIKQQVHLSEDAPRLVIVAYQPNPTAAEILKVCIQSIQKFTQIPHELWVVDNNSPIEFTRWLLEWPEINIVLNRTAPAYPKYRDIALGLKYLLKGQKHPYEGSYANAIGLEIGARLVNPDTKYFMALHMDTMAIRFGWLSFLISKMENDCAASGVCMQTNRVPDGILHVSGYVVDFQVFKQLNLDFFPKLPSYDVGDFVSVKLRDAGYRIFSCPSTYETPQLMELIPKNSPLRSMVINCSFNDTGDPIFLHLARGIGKSTGEYRKSDRTSPDEWIQFASNVLLTDVENAREYL